MAGLSGMQILGNLAGGAAQGIQVGSNINAQREKLKIAEQEVQAEKERKQLESWMKTYSTLAKNTSEAIKGISKPTPGPVVVPPEEQKEAIIAQMEQILTQHPAAQKNPGLAQTTLSALRNTQTAYAQEQQKIMEEEAKARAGATGKAAGEFSSAAGIANQIGTTGEEKRKFLLRGLGLDDDKQPAFLSLVEALADAPPGTEAHTYIKGRLNKLTSDAGFTLSTDRDGNVKISYGGSAGDIPQVTGGKLDELRGQLSQIQTGVSIVDGALKQLEVDPSRFGAVGSAKRFAGTAAGIAKDIAQAGLKAAGMDVSQAFESISNVIEMENADPAVKNAIRPASAGQVDVYEAILRYAVARTLQPDGKLLLSTVEAATQMTKLTGLTSSEMVKDRLVTIKQLFQSNSRDIQRRMQQGVGGATNLQKIPAADIQGIDDPDSEEGLKEAVQKILERQLNQ